MFDDFLLAFCGGVLCGAFGNFGRVGRDLGIFEGFGVKFSAKKWIFLDSFFGFLEFWTIFGPEKIND